MPAVVVEMHATGRRIEWACVLLLLLAAVRALPARAYAEGLHVETQVDPCVPLDADKFASLLDLELGAEPVDAAAETAARISLSCSETLILLSVEDAVTRKVVTRLVSLSSVDPSARARLMALTAAELVLASWMEVRMEPRPVIPPAGPPPAPALTERVNEVVTPVVKGAAPPLRLGASATASTFLSALAPIFGLSLHLTAPFSSTWAWNLSLLGGRGSLDGKIGERSASVSVAVTTAALAWSLRYTHTLAGVDVWLGAAALVGVAHLTGAVPAAGSLMGTPAFAPWAGPALQLAAAYPVSQQLRVLLQLEGGLLLLGTRALVRMGSADKPLVVTELRGGWLTAQLGIDYAL
jgi:hypothetical protein